MIAVLVVQSLKEQIEQDGGDCSQADGVYHHQDLERGTHECFVGVG